jgi:hypothetical protein
MFVALGACVLFSLKAQAQERQSDAVYVSGRLAFFNTGSTAGGGGIEWLHPVTPAASLNLGAFAFSYPDSQWSYGKLGGNYFLYQRKTILSGEANVGAGSGTSGAFTYQIFKAEITQAVIDKRLYVAIEEQYFHVGRPEENLVKVGLIVHPIHALTARLGYYVHTGGNVESQFFVARADWLVRQVTLMAGGGVGQTVPERFNLITGTGAVVHMEQFFAGVSVPVGRQELSIIFDTMRFHGTGFGTVQLFTTILGTKISF